MRAEEVRAAMRIEDATAPIGLPVGDGMTTVDVAMGEMEAKGVKVITMDDMTSMTCPGRRKLAEEKPKGPEGIMTVSFMVLAAEVFSQALLAFFHRDGELPPPAGSRLVRSSRESGRASGREPAPCSAALVSTATRHVFGAQHRLKAHPTTATVPTHRHS